MRPSDLLAAKSKGNTVSIIPIGGAGWFYVGGASVPSNLKGGRFKSAHNLTLVVEKKGIVALTVNYQVGKSNHSIDFFLSLSNDDGEAKVDLRDQWFPEADRLGNVGDYGTVNALVGNKWYCSDKDNAKKNDAFYVSDADLLCRYLDRKAEADEVRKAVSEEVKTKEQIEEDLKSALSEADKLKRQLKESQSELLKTTRDLLAVSEERNEVHSKYTDLLREHVEALECHENLKKYIKAIHSNIMRMKLSLNHGYSWIKNPLAYYLNKMELKNVETGKPFKSI